MTNTYLTPVLLLCVECHEPIKATITTAPWIKIDEQIGPNGECQSCTQMKKRIKDQIENRTYAEDSGSHAQSAID